MEKENISNYIDITKDYYQSAKPKNHNVTHAKKFVDDEDNVFVVNNKRSGAFFDYNSKDYKETIKCAHLLRNLFGGKIELQPIVNYKDGISTCDFKWKPPCSNKLEKWD